MEKDQTKNTTSTMELLALRDSLDILASKWKLTILQFLYNCAEEMNNFTKIENGVQSISAKTLAKELKSLEVTLLVDRRQLPTRAGYCSV